MKLLLGFLYVCAAEEEKMEMMGIIFLFKSIFALKLKITIIFSINRGV